MTIDKRSIQCYPFSVVENPFDSHLLGVTMAIDPSHMTQLDRPAPGRVASTSLASLKTRLESFLRDHQAEIAAGNTELTAEILANYLVIQVGLAPCDQPRVFFDSDKPSGTGRSGVIVLLDGTHHRFLTFSGGRPPTR